eukprot:12720211-Heterocapsa_arctica.AAC.1
MECGTLTGQPKEELIVMAYACCANVGKRVDFNTYGGNVRPATHTQIITGYSYRRSKRKGTRSHNASGQQELLQHIPLRYLKQNM